MNSPSPKRTHEKQFFVALGCTVINLFIFVCGPEEVQGFAMIGTLLCAVGAVCCYLVDAEGA